MNKSIKRRTRTTLARLAAAALIFLGGYVLGTVRPIRPTYAQGDTPPELETLFAPFWEVWEHIHDDFVYQPLDDEALVEGAIRGMLDVLDDPYTEYLSPDAYALSLEEMSGEFEGIGAEVSQDDDGALIIVSPMSGSPAEEAGLLAGDRVIAVDGDDIRDLTLSEISLLVRGPAGTPVTLTVDRHGDPETFEVTIVRARIPIDYIAWEIIEEDILYIHLTSFGSDTDTELREVLSEAITPDISGIILDLRGNPGGWLDTVLAIAEEFIPEGVLLIERLSSGADRTYESDGDGLAYDAPMVVMIDEGSASASEVLAGAIQAHARGTIVGSQSFGKGTVQVWRNLNNGGGLRVTTSQWLTPEGRWIHGYGITPDVLVNWPAPHRAGEPDPELEAAIAILRGYSIWPNWPLTWLDLTAVRRHH